MFAWKVLAFCVTLLLTEAAVKSPRLMFGQLAHSQVKFPHHVLVGTCGGSIIHKNWILTTNSCIGLNGKSLEIKFERFYYGVNVFALNVNNDGKVVTKHPFADIALIKLPVDLQFNENLKNIELYQASKLSFDSNSIGVVPGFDEKPIQHSELKYGMFQFEPLISGDCQKQKLIDEFTQLCTVSYNGYPGNPLCSNDIGSGLVVGWNEKPLLSGLLTKGTCSAVNKAEKSGNEIYTKVDAFIPWIETVTGVKLADGTTALPPNVRSAQNSKVNTNNLQAVPMPPVANNPVNVASQHQQVNKHMGGPPVRFSKLELSSSASLDSLPPVPQPRNEKKVPPKPLSRLDLN